MVVKKVFSDLTVSVLQTEIGQFIDEHLSHLIIAGNKENQLKVLSEILVYLCKDFNLSRLDPDKPIEESERAQRLISGLVHYQLLLDKFPIGDKISITFTIAGYSDGEAIDENCVNRFQIWCENFDDVLVFNHSGLSFPIRSEKLEYLRFEEIKFGFSGYAVAINATQIKVYPQQED